MGTIGSAQSWLRSSYRRALDWLSQQSETFQELNESLEPLPLEIQYQLQQRVDRLPEHPDDRGSLKAALEKAISRWKADPQNCENCMAVLSSPVDSVASLLSSSLLSGSESRLNTHYLRWPERPAVDKIKPHLDADLSKDDSVAEQETVSASEIIVIPQLENCFLRSVDGLEGIEYLRDELLDDRSRFWVLGISAIGWQYLSKVCDLDSYCLNSFALPKLTGSQLKSWLQPVLEGFEEMLEFQSNSLKGHFSEDSDKDLEADYFEALSEQSEGNSLIAADLFLQSLAYSPKNTKGKGEDQASSDKEKATYTSIQARYPDQPSLPELSIEEKYILHSILLHREISLEDLAQSLGENQDELCGNVQSLKQKNIIERSSLLKLNSAYFSRIKKQLKNDNFLI